MKINNLLIASLVMMLFFSCKKDKENNPATNYQRTKQVAYMQSNADSASKIDFTYEGERLIHSSEYYKDNQNNWVEAYKVNISYSGDVATINLSENQNGNWMASAKTEMLINDGLIKEERYFEPNDDSWIEHDKYIYSYSGNNMIAWQYYTDQDMNGIMELNGKGEYIYADNRLVEYGAYLAVDSNNWLQVEKEVFTNTGENLTTCVNYDSESNGSWVKYLKFDAQYTENQIDSRSYYYWYDDIAQWVIFYSETYSYDFLGYLTKELYKDGSWNTFEYEEGIGNATYFYYFFETSIYGYPRIRGANEEKKYVPYYQRIKNK